MRIKVKENMKKKNDFEILNKKVRLIIKTFNVFAYNILCIYYILYYIYCYSCFLSLDYFYRFFASYNLNIFNDGYLVFNYYL